MTSRMVFLVISAVTVTASIELASGCSATPTNTFPGGSGGGTTNTGSGQGGDDIGFDSGVGGHNSSSGGVPQTCADAITNQSYIGCEYWPTVTSNAGLYTGFEYAITAANPTASMATVKVERGASVIKQVDIAPGQLETIKLPWVPELKGSDPTFDGSGITSALVSKGAYKVTSTVPITLYQFNPLEFELSPAPSDCDDGSGNCNSYTNDASLVLPKSALRGEYYVMGYPTMHIGQASIFETTWVNSPGFVSITATEDGTQVTVDSTSHVRSGPSVAAMSAGQKGTYNLNAGDVLQLVSGSPANGPTPTATQQCIEDFLQGITYCPTAPSYDLTGSHITATKPVSVIGGHDCTFVPFSNFACDHLEESLFPVETLGKDLIVTAPISVASIGQKPGSPDNMFVRVLSAADSNEISFDPPVHAPVTLGAGKWLEIGPVKQDFRVKASDRVLVGQYMVGQNFGTTPAEAGDPSFSIGIPTEQYRLEYSFLAPTTYTHNIVNVVTKTGANITIDGAAIPANEFTPIGGTGMSVARHVISGGAHRMVGDQNFGIVVYGYGSYTSYMYPGGLNLETIIIVPD